MGQMQLKLLTEAIKSDTKGFIGDCDNRYDQAVMDGASQVADNLKNCPITLLAGPSGSGKTTTASRLSRDLATHGIGSHMISLDGYYLNCTPNMENYPKTDTGEPDFESPLGLDIELLNTHLDCLARGETIMVPHYDFETHSRQVEKAYPLQLKKDEVVVFEGLHGLSPLFTQRHPQAFRLFVTTQSDLLAERTWFRLLRRCVRDLYHRASPATETLGLWRSVCRGENLYIRPYAHLANVTIDTTLGYELPVLFPVAEPQFFELPDNTPQMDLILAIQRAADKLPHIAYDLLPKTSLLKEEFLIKSCT